MISDILIIAFLVLCPVAIVTAVVYEIRCFITGKQ